MEFHCGRLVDRIHLRASNLEASKTFWRVGMPPLPPSTPLLYQAAVATTSGPASASTTQAREPATMA